MNIDPDQVMSIARISGDRESSLKSYCSCLPKRWLFAALASIGLCIQNIFSVIMSITIIEMVVQTEILEEQVNGSCQRSDNDSLINQTVFAYSVEKSSSFKRYSWDEYTQGIILSSFAWTNTIVQFFYGSLAERFGGKYLLGFGILAQAVITFITPFAVNWGGSTALIITRVLIGLGSDGMFAVVSKMIPHWSAAEERTAIGNTIYSGPVLGSFFGNIMSVLIMKYSGLGWPGVFYIFSFFGIAWFPFWLLFVYENPEVHPFITDEEMQYLHRSSEAEKVTNKLPFTPWKHIFLCKEFWAFTISFIGVNWAYYLMLSDLPRYMGKVVKFPLESNGYFSGFPFLFMWLNSLLSAWMSDKILQKQWMSLTNVRKLLTTISIVGPGIFLLLASYAECNKAMVVIMFLIGITLIGNVYSSLIMNPMDLSPNYAGSIMSVGSGIASLASILAPYLVGVLVPNSTLTEWRLVFWMVFSFACCSIVVYLCLFKAEVQPWNDPNFIRESKHKTMKREVDVEL